MRYIAQGNDSLFQPERGWCFFFGFFWGGTWTCRSWRDQIRSMEHIVSLDLYWVKDGDSLLIGHWLE